MGILSQQTGTDLPGQLLLPLANNDLRGRPCHWSISSQTRDPAGFGISKLGERPFSRCGTGGDLLLNIHHDEDAEIYINGSLAAKVAGFVTNYSLMPITNEARKALKVGKNTIAIHCHQTGGGQYIDAGIVERLPTK